MTHLICLILTCMISNEINALSLRWTEWTEWSTCTRTCDGGLTNRRRLCLGDKHLCPGESTIYRLCNVQPCLFELKDVNNRVCESRNNVPFSGRLYRWKPVSPQQYQCFVMCEDESRNIPNVIQENIPDGTRCGIHPNNYCLQGKCVRIGCDGYVGSRKEIDACGICGGNNKSCSKNTEQRNYWSVSWTTCSATCGVGYETTVVTCKNRFYDQETFEYYCNTKTKPKAETRECRLRKCLPEWRASSWSACSVPCGGGVRKRQVTCTLDTGRGRTSLTDSYRCPDPMPLSEEPCNLEFCPSNWETEEWSQCSASCGIGVQTRTVNCVKFTQGTKIKVSNIECRGPKPQVSRACSQPPCYQSHAVAPTIQIENDTFIQMRRTKRLVLKVGEKATILAKQPVKVVCPVINFKKELIFWTRNNRLIPVVNNRSRRKERVVVSRNGALIIRRSDPHLDKGEFTCIAGLQSASIHLDFTSKRKAAKVGKSLMENVVPDNETSFSIDKPQADNIPAERQSQDLRNNQETEVTSPKYKYSTTSWSPCSKTCGLGVQSRDVTCLLVVSDYLKIVSKDKCTREGHQKPPSLKSCLEREFCPLWVPGPWKTCSPKHCKKDNRAVQSRDITCSSSNGTALEESACHGLQRPLLKQECDNAECEAVWKTSTWGKCRPRCSRRGKKYRMLTCVWRVSGKPARANCMSKPKPVVVKKCKPRKCKHRCLDTSRYCSMVGVLRMCRYPSFLEKCCQTCKTDVT